MKTALIITGGDFSPLPNSIKYDIIIACDKGVLYCQKMDLIPDIIVGDFDSLDVAPSCIFPQAQILRFPVEKDDTDTMLAIKYALENGYMHIIIGCALGNRMDHLISNVQSLHYVSNRKGIAEIYSETEHLRTFSSFERSLSVKKKTGYSLSVFSFSDTSNGVSISGTKYTADNIALSSDFPLGHGNHIESNEAIITVKEGTLIIIESKLD